MNIGPAAGVRWQDDVRLLCVVFVECMHVCLLLEELCVVLECMLLPPFAWRFAEMLIHVHFGKFLH